MFKKIHDVMPNRSRGPNVKNDGSGQLSQNDYSYTLKLKDYNLKGMQDPNAE